VVIPLCNSFFGDKKLQALKSLVLSPMRLLGSSVDLLRLNRTVAVGSTEPLTGMSTRNLPARNERAARA
jgi:hypothetical protein